MTRLPEPDEQNGFLKDHVSILLRSFRRWAGRDLLDAALDLLSQQDIRRHERT
jgi:hypothetical protein